MSRRGHSSTGVERRSSYERQAPEDSDEDVEKDSDEESDDPDVAARPAKLEEAGWIVGGFCAKKRVKKAARKTLRLALEAVEDARPRVTVRKVSTYYYSKF